MGSLSGRLARKGRKFQLQPLDSLISISLLPNGCENGACCCRMRNDQNGFRIANCGNERDKQPRRARRRASRRRSRGTSKCSVSTHRILRTRSIQLMCNMAKAPRDKYSKLGKCQLCCAYEYVPMTRPHTYSMCVSVCACVISLSTRTCHVSCSCFCLSAPPAFVTFKLVS